MLYDDLLKEQKKLLDEAREFLKNYDFDSFNQKMNEFNLLADKYLQSRKWRK